MHLRAGPGSRDTWCYVAQAIFSPLIQENSTGLSKTVLLVRRLFEIHEEN